MTTMAAQMPFSTDPLQVGSKGASDVANVVRDFIYRTRRHARANASDWRTLAESLVHQLRRESLLSDDDDSKPVLAETELQAIRFISALSAQLPRPEVAVDPDGELSFDWWYAPHAQFSVSVGPTGTLTYAGLIGKGAKRYGVEPFTREIPPVVLGTIQELALKFSSQQPR
jgi:hypothetical protein